LPAAPAVPFQPVASVTLRMVAQAAGVSMTTASRVINNSPLVKPATRAAVNAVIERLGFVPNVVARALAADAHGRQGVDTHTIGLVAQHFASPYYAQLLRGIDEALSAAGFGLAVASGHWDRAEEEQCVRNLRSRGVSGLIVLTGQLGDDFLTALAAELPVVVTGRSLAAPGLHALRSDDFEGARAATRHLIERGHTRIAHIAGDPRHPDSLDRERGYRAALLDAGLAPDPALVATGDYREASGERAAEQLLQGGKPFTAIFAANDQMATGAAQALYRHGLCVPDDVSLVGFDDIPMAAHATPPRTTVSLSIPDLGRRAAEAMLQLLDGGQPTVAAPEPELVMRASVRRV